MPHDRRSWFQLPPLLLSLSLHRLAVRALRLQPRPRGPGAIRTINPLRDDALQPHLPDVPEDRRAVAGQVVNVLDRAPTRLPRAEQGLQPPLALDKRLLAQVSAVLFEQVERDQHHLA